MQLPAGSETPVAFVVSVLVGGFRCRVNVIFRAIGLGFEVGIPLQCVAFENANFVKSAVLRTTGHDVTVFARGAGLVGIEHVESAESGHTAFYGEIADAVVYCSVRKVADADSRSKTTTSSLPFNDCR